LNGDTGSTNLETYLSTSSILENDLDQGVDLQDQVTTPPKVESINLLDVLILSVKEMENVVFKIEFLLEIC